MFNNTSHWLVDEEEFYFTNVESNTVGRESGERVGGKEMNGYSNL